MDPITSFTYILSAFFGYYIGSDIWNQNKFTSELNKIKNRLDSVNSSLSRIESKLH